MEILDHFVLPLNVFLYPVQIFRSLPIVLLLLPVNWICTFPCIGEDILDGVGHYEIFIGFQPLDGFFGNLWNWVFLMVAVI